MSRRSQRRRRKLVAGAKATAPRLSVPGGTRGLRLSSVFQRPGPMSVAARVGRLAIALPLVLIGAAGIFMVVALPGTYGNSIGSIVGMNTLTLLVSAAVAAFGAMMCVNAVRAPRK